jgi:putative peptide modification system cyclase
MNAIHEEPSGPVPASELTPSPPLLRTLLACDLVESTSLTEQLGDRSIADFMHQLDRQVRDLLERHGGTEIDKTDGFLLMFDRPIPAVAFALDYQRMLHNLGLAEFLPLKARIGIHVGDVVLWRNAANDVARGAKPIEVEGLVKPVASRLMGLALPGQILLSGVARALALRAQDELEIDFPPQWRMHGRYCFKGVAEPVPVFEVGETGIAPLRAPAYSGKAYREVPWWRRPSLLVVEGAVLLAAVLIPVWLSLRSPPVIAFADRDWVVVGNLKNLTDEHRFDEALETAFRLGLEQSHFVNVMSELKVRDTIALMQRDPNKTPLDRSVGSEVAIRDGARALILPTVSEVGQRVRITAEVVDPSTQTSVYTESADGVGADSVLASIDQINQRLREHLGETLAAVSRDSQPLDKATTKNLDALRAYSLGRRAYATGDMKEALSFFEAAVQLDQHFALAHISIATVHGNAGENEAMLEHVRAAAANPDRMSARDVLYVDAWQTTLTKPQDALRKWKSVTSLYPDFYPANGAYAYYAWDANHYKEAIPAAVANASPHNAKASAGIYLLGILYLATDQYKESLEQFRRAAEVGFGRNDFYALAYAATRQFDKADALLNKNKASGRIADDFGTIILRLAILTDGGHWKSVSTLLDSARKEAGSAGARLPQQLAGIELGIRNVFDKVSAQALKSYANTELNASTNNTTDRSQALFHALFATYLLAHLDVGSATALTAEIDAAVREIGDEPLLNLLSIAQAEVARAGGHADQAIAILKPLIDGNELYLTHLALLDAYTDSDAKSDALGEAKWLSSHRGRAYAEYGAQQFLTTFNVAQSDLALLREAELDAALGIKDEGRIALEAFTSQWLPAELPAAISARVSAVSVTP